MLEPKKIKKVNTHPYYVTPKVQNGFLVIPKKEERMAVIEKGSSITKEKKKKPKKSLERFLPKLNLERDKPHILPWSLYVDSRVFMEGKSPRLRLYTHEGGREGSMELTLEEAKDLHKKLGKAIVQMGGE